MIATSESAVGSGGSAEPTASFPQSLLKQLRAPIASDVTWKHKVRVNALPHTGARKKKPACQMDPKGVSVIQRVREVSNEMATISSGKLFCFICHEELSLKLSVVA